MNVSEVIWEIAIAAVLAMGFSSMVVVFVGLL